jgi:nucleoside-diphosphate-sugar epimerase
MHALVTGGGGFLGRYICEQLVARGDRVRSFGRGAYPDLEALGVEVVRGDVVDLAAFTEACRGVDCVFHVAARAGVGVDSRPFFATNSLGTKFLMRACRSNGVRRIVYTSSPSVTFAGNDQCGVDEAGSYGVRRDLNAEQWQRRHGAWYSASKASAEELVLGCDDPPDTRTCALRPHLIWGPRDAHLIPRLIDRARRGRLRRVGDGSNLVDICYVENAAAAHLAAADALAEPNSPVVGKAYYISQGEPVNCWQWIDEVLALAGLPPVEKAISYNAARRIGAAFEFVYRTLRLKGEPPMTRFLAGQLAKSHYYDISAARRDFGYEPRISTAEGMRRLATWLRASA